jgi:hypothetical protein
VINAFGFAFKTGCDKFQAIKVSLELPYLSVVGIHRVLLDVACLIDLVYDELGVAISDEPLGSQGNSDAQSMDQGLVFGAVVGHLVVDLQDVFQVIALRGDEEYSHTRPFEVQGTIKVHLRVLRLLRQWGLLGLCPFKDEVCEDLGLDSLSWTEVKFKLV